MSTKELITEALESIVVSYELDYEMEMLKNEGQYESYYTDEGAYDYAYDNWKCDYPNTTDDIFQIAWIMWIQKFEHYKNINKLVPLPIYNEKDCPYAEYGFTVK